MNRKDKKIVAKPNQQAGRKIVEKLRNEIKRYPNVSWTDFSQHRKD